MRKLPLLALPLLLGTAVVGHADAPVTSSYKFKGNYANADLFTTGECGNTALSLMASEEVEKVNGDKTVKRRAVVLFSGYDVCEGLNWGGDTEVVLDKPLNLSANAVAFELDVNYVNPDTGEHFVRHVKGTIALSANGDLEKSRERRVSLTGGVRTVVTATGNSRFADVTGTVTVDDVPLAFGGSSGVLGETKNGTVETTRL
jgi:hypothetical protein